MAFFSNQAVNRLNLHSTIQTFAQSAGGIFVFVYLLKAGVPAPLVFCSVAGMSASRFLLRPMVLPLARRIGLRQVLLTGTVLESAVYPLLSAVHGVGAPLIAVILGSSVGSVLYWTSYHAFFAALGDDEHRGRQVAVREALGALVSIAGPLLGGWTLVTAGPRIMFAGVAVIQALAALPLIGAPSVKLAREPRDGRRDYLRGVLLLGSDGLAGAGLYYVWQVALFIALGEQFAGYGGAMALAMVAGALGSLIVGRFIDLGHARRSFLAVYAFALGVMALKACGYRSVPVAIAANALGGFAASLTNLSMGSRLYVLAKSSPCPLRFTIATEGGWDTGCILGCLLAAAFASVGAGFAGGILIGGCGLIASAAMLIAGARPQYPQATAR